MEASNIIFYYEFLFRWNLSTITNLRIARVP